MQYDLGVTYGDLGRWDDAIEAFKQAIRIKPDYALGQFASGSVHLIKEDKNSVFPEDFLAEIFWFS